METNWLSGSSGKAASLIDPKVPHSDSIPGPILALFYQIRAILPA